MYDMTTHVTESKAVSKGPCDCGSSDANVEYDDGHKYCFVCTAYTHSGDDTVPFEGGTVVQMNSSSLSKGQQFLTERKITEGTSKKYGVTSDNDKHYYPYHDQDGKAIANKVRNVADKSFFAEGNLHQSVMFGQQLFPKGGKYITLCEGELDAMSAFQMMGSKYPSVSLKTGAAGAVKDCKAQYEYLNSFDTIVITFDMDEPGQLAANKVAQIFEPNKCKITNLPMKDPNEMLQQGKAEDFTRAWWASSVYTPAGIINLADIGDALYDETNQYTVLFPWKGMNDMLYGMRTGEVLTLTAGTGTGKSSVLRELAHHIVNTTDDKVGLFSLEENVKQSCFHLMSVEANARLNIKEIRDTYSREQLKKWEAATIGTGKFFAFDHFGSMDNDEILDRVRYMVKALDCKWILLDHLSILVSGQEGGDERKSIDILMTKLRSLVEETQCGLLLVSHLRRTSSDKGAEQGQEINLSHLRGSQSIAQLSDGVVAMERNQQATTEAEANTTVMRVLKNRYAGINGISTYLLYDKDTGRLHETDGPDADEDNEFNTYDTDYSN